MTDPIADMLTRIRNAYLARKKSVAMPYSKMKHSLANILHQQGYLAEVSVVEKKFKTLTLALRYVHKLPSVTSLIRLSTPGRRHYVRTSQLKPVLSGSGLSIISTSKGLMTNSDAKRLKLGGELICKVW